MSVPVPLEDLRTAVAARRAPAFLVTVSDDGRPHAVAARPALDGDVLRVEAGSRTRANAAARPLVSLVWPPDEPGAYNLIVDATVVATTAEAVVMTPTWAVLHRPALDPDAPVAPGACGADCVPIPPPTPAG
jgi:hypothetical protein